MATLQEITERMQTAVGTDSGLGKTLKFNLKGDGFIYIDGGSVTNEDKPADLTITISKADLEAMGAGKLDGMTAVMTGKMQLSDMGLAMSPAKQDDGAVLKDDLRLGLAEPAPLHATPAAAIPAGGVRGMVRG